MISSDRMTFTHAIALWGFSQKNISNFFEAVGFSRLSSFVRPEMAGAEPHRTQNVL